MDETRGFKVAADAPLIAPCDVSEATRATMVKILAAIIAGATPEEIVVYQADGWPEVVTEMLDRSEEIGELSAHVDLLVAAQRAGESTDT